VDIPQKFGTNLIKHPLLQLIPGIVWDVNP